MRYITILFVAFLTAELVLKMKHQKASLCHFPRPYISEIPRIPIENVPEGTWLAKRTVRAD